MPEETVREAPPTGRRLRLIFEAVDAIVGEMGSAFDDPETRQWAVKLCRTLLAEVDEALDRAGNVVECEGCGATPVAADDPYHQPDTTDSYPCCVGDRE